MNWSLGMESDFFIFSVGQNRPEACSALLPADPNARKTFTQKSFFLPTAQPETVQLRTKRQSRIETKHP